MNWKKISVEMMDKMTHEQRLFHLKLNPHGEWDREVDWDSMTRAQRVLRHRELHLRMRSQVSPERPITHDHPRNSY